jgi:menaquinone-dependent protoporphyrinogen oxidase
MHILIAYATRQGQTGKIARHIAAVLAREGHTPELCDLDREREPGPASFDGVIVAAPIHAGGYPPAVIGFLRRSHALLNALPSAFVSVGLAIASKTHDGRAQTLPIVGKLLRHTGWQPQATELVAGALVYSQYRFLTRYVMRRIASKEGGDTDTSRDYEYTDWAALERFTRAFAEKLARSPAKAPAA